MSLATKAAKVTSSTTATTQFCFFIFLIVFKVSVFAQNPVQDPVPNPVPSAVQNSVPTAPLVPADQTITQPLLNQTAPTIPASPLALPTDQKNSGSFKRDPFRLPKYLIDKITYKPPPTVVIEEKAIDDRAEPIRRWPVREYLLVGIIWEVKNPKGLVKDLQGKVHVVRLRDRMGNKEGIVTSIKEGAITVTEKKVPFVLRLKK